MKWVLLILLLIPSVQAEEEFDYRGHVIAKPGTKFIYRNIVWVVISKDPDGRCWVEKDDFVGPMESPIWIWESKIKRVIQGPY